jgi:hypothetical protein
MKLKPLFFITGEENKLEYTACGQSKVLAHRVDTARLENNTTVKKFAKDKTL